MHAIPDSPTARLALDTIHHRPTHGTPAWMLHVMEHAQIERIAGVEPGEYRRRPEEVYLACQRNAGVCMIDQFIPDNPLTMGDHGYEGAEKGATTGGDRVTLDGVVIDSPEAVAGHMERFVFPRLRRAIATFDEDRRAAEIVDVEAAVQERLAPTILKAGFDFVRFPTFAYGDYGYENYFMAYALYPEIIERHFSLQADLALCNNRAAARAYAGAKLPPLHRLDYDMADSRGMLVDIRSLDRIWFPHLVRCLTPMLRTDVRLIWHCDGNLMQMVPRLLEVGIKGFQGFQYEDGMDYEKICRMKTRDGDGLTIIAGVSVTRTLPYGTPDDVKRELAWLVEKGPSTGLFLGCSSSVAPGAPWENIRTLIEGLAYYRAGGGEKGVGHRP
jgi:hypothetical protein